MDLWSISLPTIFQLVMIFFHGHVLHILISKIYSKLPCYDLKKFKPMCFCRSKCTKNVQILKLITFAIVSDFMFDMYWGVPLMFLNDTFMMWSDNMFRKVRELVSPAVISSWNYFLSKKFIELIIAASSINEIMKDICCTSCKCVIKTF